MPNEDGPSNQAPEHLPKRPEGVTGVNYITARIFDATKKLLTITDHLRALEKEDDRIQGQLRELSRLSLDLTKEVAELSGLMKNIEKRFDDKDKLVEAVIKMRIAEELERIIPKYLSGRN